MKCVKCSKPLPEPAATGRPRSYCSDTCRRAGEYALRRSQSLLLRLEKRRQDELFRIDDWRTPAQKKAELGRIDKEIARLETRLAELLAGGIGEPDR